MSLISRGQVSAWHDSWEFYHTCSLMAGDTAKSFLPSGVEVCLLFGVRFGAVLATDLGFVEVLGTSRAAFFVLFFGGVLAALVASLAVWDLVEAASQ